MASPNRIHLVAGPLPNCPVANPYYWISPDWVKVSYPARANAATIGSTSRALHESTDPGGDLWLHKPRDVDFDVRDPAPRCSWMALGVVAAPAVTPIYWDETEPDPSYVLTTEAALLAPGASSVICHQLV
jgi:hypothetical protein